MGRKRREVLEAKWQAKGGSKDSRTKGGAFPREVLEEAYSLRAGPGDVVFQPFDWGNPVPRNKIVEALIVLAAIRPSFEAALDDMIHLGLNVPDWKKRAKKAKGTTQHQRKESIIGSLVEVVVNRERVEEDEACELVAALTGVRAAKKPGGSFGNAILSVKRAYEHYMQTESPMFKGVCMGWDDEAFPVRLSELKRKRADVLFLCNNCSAQVHVDPAKLNLPDDMPAHEVREHRPCPKCKSQHVKTVGDIRIWYL